MVLAEQSPSWQDGTAEGGNGVATGRDAGQQEQEAGWLMGTVCPGFRPVYSVCPMGPQMRPNPTGTNLTRQGPADFRTAQNAAGTSQPACSLLSCNIDDSLAGFSATLSIMPGTDVTISWKPHCFTNIFP